jgi:hypothetical protein
MDAAQVREVSSEPPLHLPSFISFRYCWCLVHGSDTSRGRLLYIHHPEFLGVPDKTVGRPQNSGELSNKTHPFLQIKSLICS